MDEPDKGRPKDFVRGRGGQGRGGRGRGDRGERGGRGGRGRARDRSNMEVEPSNNWKNTDENKGADAQPATD